MTIFASAVVACIAFNRLFVYSFRPQKTSYFDPKTDHLKAVFFIRRGVRVAEGARLESVYALIAYRGFESLSLRHIKDLR